MDISDRGSERIIIRLIATGYYFQDERSRHMLMTAAGVSGEERSRFSLSGTPLTAANELFTMSRALYSAPEAVQPSCTVFGRVLAVLIKEHHEGILAGYYIWKYIERHAEHKGDYEAGLKLADWIIEAAELQPLPPLPSLVELTKAVPVFPRQEAEWRTLLADAGFAPNTPVGALPKALKTLSTEDSGLIAALLGGLTVFRTAVELDLFLKRAKLSTNWINNYDWEGARKGVIHVLLDVAQRHYYPMDGKPEWCGFTLLGVILNQLFEDTYLDLEVQEDVARLIRDYHLILKKYWPKAIADAVQRLESRDSQTPVAGNA